MMVMMGWCIKNDTHKVIIIALDSCGSCLGLAGAELTVYFQSFIVVVFSASRIFRWSRSPKGTDKEESEEVWTTKEAWVLFCTNKRTLAFHSLNIPWTPRSSSCLLTNFLRPLSLLTWINVGTTLCLFVKSFMFLLFSLSLILLLVLMQSPILPNLIFWNFISLL